MKKISDVKITAAIVIYNKNINDSITYKNLNRINLDIDILVIDNSDIKINNKQYCENYGIRYLSMDGNKGLSKAYNTAVNNSKNSDVILLFDDDTEIKEEYFSKLQDSLVNSQEIDIFAPIIRGQDGIFYSPNEFNFLRNHFITSPDQEVSQDLFNAISSCLAIRMRVFENYRFNERLFVDQVDQYFFWEQRSLGRKFGKINVEIQQNFHQRYTTLTAKDGWRRLRLRIFDIFRYARLIGGGKYILLAFIKCCGLGIQIGKKSKSVSVIIKAGLLSSRLIFIDE